jgi:outer membrane protein OmpA-like peptidoglycan-associated protein
MRRLLLVAAFVIGVGAPASSAAQKPSLKVMIDRAKVDLAHKKLEVKLSRTCERITVKVQGESGATLAETENPCKGVAAGTAIDVGWTQSTDEPIAKVEVWGYDTEGYYAGVAIVPWKMSVPHQEVSFATDSDVIGPNEVPKLEASLTQIRELAQKHADLGRVTLYVLGHTDTVGSPEHNVGLSRRRARAIAGWFKARGLAIPIAWEGLGERALLVKTPDDTDESRNRRVDYILALDAPALPATDASWKSL